MRETKIEMEEIAIASLDYYKKLLGTKPTQRVHINSNLEQQCRGHKEACWRQTSQKRMLNKHYGQFQEINPKS